MANLASVEVLATKIIFLRGKRVLLDMDLAYLYHVSTKALNQAVKRNIERFPEDFMFQLTKVEKEEVVTNCDHLKALNFPRSYRRHLQNKALPCFQACSIAIGQLK